MNPTSFTSKLPNVGTTIFTVMSKLAVEHGAINLSQGFPDFESDKKLMELVLKAMKKGHNQYAPMPGLLSLREEICNKLNTLYNSAYNPETDVTVTAGATQAIFTILTAFIKKDDEVIVFTPAYDCYEPAIILNGGKPVRIPLKTPGFFIDWQEVKNRITAKTRMIIINSPHNPSGSILKESDLLQLRELVKDTSILLLSDEVYEHLVFDGKEHQSIAKFPELANRGFITASFGKTFHNTGWKTGYCTAPKALMEEFRKVHQFNVFSVNHPVQHALAEYLKEPEHYTYLNDFYQEKRDLFLAGVRNSRFKFTPAEGTYFQLLDYSEITDEDDVNFAKRLTMEKKLASIPISVFGKAAGESKVLRFCFAKSGTTLKQATEILSTL